jgi:hypothetical protein
LGGICDVDVFNAGDGCSEESFEDKDEVIEVHIH